MVPVAAARPERDRRTAMSCGCSNYRDTTPLGAGQVDDSPYGGGAGMVMRVDVVDAALRGRLRPERGAAADGAALRPRGGCSTTRWRPSCRRSPTWRCSAGATRASTSGSTSTSPTTRSRSGATCSPAASCRRWWSPTPCCASCPARSATPTARSRSPSAQALEGAPEYPHYTRPPLYRGWDVPDVLLSGDHERVRLGERAEQGAGGAARKRPEAYPAGPHPGSAWMTRGCFVLGRPNSAAIRPPALAPLVPRPPQWHASCRDRP